METYAKDQKSTKSLKKTVSWEPASDIALRVSLLVKKLENKNMDQKRIFCFRSYNTKTRAIARIWGLNRVWQQALKVKPAYALEVISEKFDKLKDRQQDEVLIHELAHIPSNFSGSLVPHIRKGKRNFYIKVKNMIKKTL